MASAVDTSSMATGARHELRMILLGRTGTGTQSHQTNSLYRIIHFLFLSREEFIRKYNFEYDQI